MNPLEALKQIRDARDHNAEHGKYPDYVTKRYAAFDDWAADLADRAMANRDGTSGAIRFDGHAAKSLQHLLDQFANGRYSARITLADGTAKDVALSAAPDGDTYDTYGRTYARDWDETKGEGVGEPYLLDFYGETDGGALHIAELLIY